MDLKRDWRKKIVVIVAMMLVFGSAILVSVSARPVLEADRIPTGEHQGSEQSESEETIIESEDIPLGSGNVSESQETTEVVDAERILVADRIPSGNFTEDEVGGIRSSHRRVGENTFRIHWRKGIGKNNRSSGCKKDFRGGSNSCELY